MSDQVTEIKVFVASPGDVSQERKHLHEVLEEINTSLGPRKLRLKYVGWEQVYPGMGRPQEVINEQISPEDCDFFIGIMWSRFGTPTGGFGSGTEEEFQKAYGSWAHNKKPRIFFYFCSKAPTFADEDDLEQYRKVMRFRRSLEADKGLIWTYPGSKGFQKLVREHLMSALAGPVPPPPPNPEAQVLEPISVPEPPPRFTAFVASVRDVLEPLRAGLIEKLILKDIEVFRPQADPEVNRALMARANVCIHLLEGGSHPVVERQFDEGRCHAQWQILWLSPRIELSAADPDPFRQKLFPLQTREGNFDFMRGRNAVAEIVERVESRREEWLRRKGRGIFFNTHGNDKSLAQEVFDYLVDQQVEALMNEDDFGEPSKSLQEFDEKARRSRAIVVFFGAVNAAWVAARLMEIMKLIYAREYAIEKLGIYAAPPPKERIQIRLPGGFVPTWMDNTKGFDPHTLDDLL
jgi:Domain of unknown function (DUF4062)